MSFAIIKYAMHLEEREENGKERLESGIRKKLQIEGKFDVPKQTIFSCIPLEWLEVWYPGTESKSPLLEVEFLLICFVFTAHRL